MGITQSKIHTTTNINKTNNHKLTIRSLLRAKDKYFNAQFQQVDNSQQFSAVFSQLESTHYLTIIQNTIYNIITEYSSHTS